MTGKIENKLAELGIILPQTAKPAGSYVPARIHGDLLYISGQLPFVDGKLEMTGKVGKDLSVEDAQEQARLCAINILAQAKGALDGDLDRVTGVFKLGGFVNSEGNFSQHPAVINGASDLMLELFDTEGQHVRFAVGASSLPLDTPVEIEAILTLK